MEWKESKFHGLLFFLIEREFIVDFMVRKLNLIFLE